MPDTPVCHETTYSRRYIGSIVHRARLNSFIQVLRRHLGEDVETWGDFGCSNGFIIESILKEGGLNLQSIVGLDHSRSLLEEAERRKIPGAVFKYYDLNGDLPSSMHFQLVTCLEALEHIKDYRHGFKHLYHHLGEGGILAITVPNETGATGLFKYFGRYVARRDPYQDFFKDQSKLKYVWSVATGRDIERFRDSSRDGHGPHLGFDYRRLERYIDAEYVQPGLLVPIEKRMTMLGMNLIFAYRKPPRVDTA